MNLEPFIKGITDMISEGATKAEHTPIDVERWLGGLSDPARQVPVVHDYLRGTQALAQADASGAQQVRGISVPVWKTAQQNLQTQVDADPEMQQSLKDLYIGSNMPKDPDAKTTVLKQPPAAAPALSVEMPDDTPTMPKARPAPVGAGLDAAARRQRSLAWNEFSVATQSQDPARIDSALESLQSLHDSDDINAAPGDTPTWRRAIDYMAGMEQQVQQWNAAKVTNDAWTDAVEAYHDQSGIDGVKMPSYMRDTVDRFKAWADAQKPPTPIDRFTQALGVPRSVMTSTSFHAVGRQGLLMISRPEYWQSLKPMFDAVNEGNYNDAQAAIRNSPDFPAALESGLALTVLHSKVASREEAFVSDMAERIPVIGPMVKGSAQAYTMFLNHLRFSVWQNTMRQAAASGVDVSDPKFMSDLAEWINTSTGRGSLGKFDPGALSTVLFSPRLAMSRFQTLNPFYYANLHPYVRMQAIKANLASAAAVYGLVSLAGLGGARVTWDFRNPDAGKIRIGNTRIDLGGGHFQFLRLFTQLLTGERVSASTGRVTKLGAKFGSPTRLDVATNFLIGKEAPIASFVTDWLRGKQMGGEPFKLTDAIIQRTVPLAVQDITEAVKDAGARGLFESVPALFGVSVQTYKDNGKKEYVPFAGVKGQVPDSLAASYGKAIEQADTLATQEALSRTRGKPEYVAQAVLRKFITVEREKARKDWIMTNRDSFVAAKKAGEKSFMMTPPDTTQ